MGKSKSRESGLTWSTISTESLDHGRHYEGSHGETRLVKRVMIMMMVILIVGMMLMVLGVILLVRGLIREDDKAIRVWWNDLFIIGLLAILTGVFLLGLNGIIRAMLPRSMCSGTTRHVPIQPPNGVRGGDQRVDRSPRQTSEVDEASVIGRSVILFENDEIDRSGVVSGTDHRGDHQRPRQDLNHQQFQHGETRKLSQNMILEAKREFVANSIVHSKSS
ncbi:uncharacterized protein LOC105426391 [Pogonomyrmex barbatus]|uniref:Uncharacterized protein LOC105426391 n=1 Tax=Pogonomyrmex barbatus TaxID=144034 RepID=A0A6I9WVH0_9HYME|nr:uncharacterized protein LOC105426391 [Pogonomyrmex barbatus]